MSREAFLPAQDRSQVIRIDLDQARINPPLVGSVLAQTRSIPTLLRLILSCPSTLFYQFLGLRLVLLVCESCLAQGFLHRTILVSSRLVLRTFSMTQASESHMDTLIYLAFMLAYYVIWKKTCMTFTYTNNTLWTCELFHLCIQDNWVIRYDEFIQVFYHACMWKKDHISCIVWHDLISWATIIWAIP
jgi:hypothetical protein